jgi:hypothetical protein
LGRILLTTVSAITISPPTPPFLTQFISMTGKEKTQTQRKTKTFSKKTRLWTVRLQSLLPGLFYEVSFLRRQENGFLSENNCLSHSSNLHSSFWWYFFSKSLTYTSLISTAALTRNSMNPWKSEKQQIWFWGALQQTDHHSTSWTWFWCGLSVGSTNHQGDLLPEASQQWTCLSLIPNQ